MKKLIFLVLIMISSGFAYSQIGEKNFIDQPYIEVTGTAELEIVPDMIYLKISINETDTKGKISLESLEKRMKQRFGDLGIDVAKDLTVNDLSSSYIKYFLKEKDVVTSREYNLLVRDATMAGRAIKAMSDENISNISVLKVDHSQMAQKRFDLRLDAVKTSKAKAEAMAGAIGQNIGKAIFIAEYTDMDPMLQSNVRGGQFANNYVEYDSEPELSFKKIKLKSSITARFILN